MVTRFVKLAAAATAVSYAGSAWAFFDVQVMAGKRWYDVDFGEGVGKRGVASQEIDVAAHLDPIPLVPVAFGASVALGNLRKGDLASPDILGVSPSEAKTFEAALDIMAWLPMVPVVTPYARFKYPVVGTWTMEMKDEGSKISSKAKLSGYHLDVGVKYSPLPIVKLLLETGIGMQKYDIDEFKVDGTKRDTENDSGDFNSKTFLVGVEIGL